MVSNEKNQTPKKIYAEFSKICEEKLIEVFEQDNKIDCVQHNNAHAHTQSCAKNLNDHFNSLIVG